MPSPRRLVLSCVTLSPQSSHGRSTHLHIANALPPVPLLPTYRYGQTRRTKNNHIPLPPPRHPPPLPAFCARHLLSVSSARILFAPLPVSSSIFHLLVPFTFPPPSPFLLPFSFISIHAAAARPASGVSRFAFRVWHSASIGAVRSSLAR